MLDTIFSGLFDTSMTQVIAVSDFLLCVGCALVIGLMRGSLISREIIRLSSF